jgi:hypothetical protein
MQEGRISSVPEELRSSWAGKSTELDHEKKLMIEEHMRVIRHVLSDRAELLSGLDGGLEELASVGRAYLQVLKEKSRDLQAWRRELKEILGHRVPITEVITLASGMLDEHHPRKPFPEMIFLGRELGHVRDVLINQLGMAHIYSSYAFDDLPKMISIFHADNTPFLTMAAYEALSYDARVELQVYESLVIKFFTLLLLPSTTDEQRQDLAHAWNGIV